MWATLRLCFSLLSALIALHRTGRWVSAKIHVGLWRFSLWLVCLWGIALQKPRRWMDGWVKACWQNVSYNSAKCSIQSDTRQQFVCCSSLLSFSKPNVHNMHKISIFQSNIRSQEKMNCLFWWPLPGLSGWDEGESAAVVWCEDYRKRVVLEVFIFSEEELVNRTARCQPART